MTGPVLICFDGSPGAVHAIEHAGVLFPGRQAIVLNLWDLPLELPAFAAADGTRGEDARRAVSAEIAAHGVALARRAGLRAQPASVCGSVEGTWQTILALAVERAACVIVVGARGLGHVRSLVLGSVSRELALHADRPVLVLPPLAGSPDALPPPRAAPRSLVEQLR